MKQYSLKEFNMIIMKVKNLRIIFSLLIKYYLIKIKNK